jgi:8-oxo-dGTP pyrophosphatase MutT (NUDIX family)
MHGADDRLRWEEHARTHVASCTLFDLYASRRSSMQGKSGEFCLLTAPDWVTVIPVLSGGNGEEILLMVRQYRHGAEIITTEFPAGLVDPGEEPLAAAARELEEETGYRAGRMTLLGRVRPNPAFMNNWFSTYLAEDLVRVGDLSLDDTEELQPLTLSRAELARRIGSGELVNSLTLVSYFLWERRVVDGGPLQ